MYSMVVGFGSIGKQHYESLKEIVGAKNLFIFSRRKLNIDNCISNLNEINLSEFNYFVIANEATLHFEWIKKLQNTNSKILVEKPLFTKNIEKDQVINKDNIYVGYYLRLHPLIKKIKKLNLTEIEKVEFVNHSWLPDWRKDREYEETVSSKKELGGGVLNELSHDLDLAKYIFDDYSFHDLNLSKNNELNLDVYDTFIGNAKNIKNNIKIDFSLSMGNKKIEKYINIYSKNDSYKADFINNSLTSNKGVEVLNNEQSSKKFLLQRQHKIILNEEENFLSKFNEGQWIVKLINEIDEQNE